MNSIKDLLKDNKKEIKVIIRDYFENFIKDDGQFDVEAYEDSAMEGEMVEAINGELCDEYECIMAGDDKAYEYVDKLADKVLKEPGFEEIVKYFAQEKWKNLT